VAIYTLKFAVHCQGREGQNFGVEVVMVCGRFQPDWYPKVWKVGKLPSSQHSESPGEILNQKRSANHDSLIDMELPELTAGERDLIVHVHAISVNPVDTKVRKSRRGDDGKRNPVSITEQCTPRPDEAKWSKRHLCP
jgi:hypothetical protein